MLAVTLAALAWIAGSSGPKTSEWLKAFDVLVIGGITVFLTFGVPAAVTLARMTKESFQQAASAPTPSSLQKHKPGGASGSHGSRKPTSHHGPGTVKTAAPKSYEVWEG